MLRTSRNQMAVKRKRRKNQAPKRRAKQKTRAPSKSKTRQRQKGSRKSARKSPRKSKRPMPKKRKIPRAKQKRRIISGKSLDNLPPPKNPLTTYALPFARGGGETEWRRFTYNQLRHFLMEYVTGKNAPARREAWREYAVEEQFEFDTREERREFRDDVEAPIFGQPIDEDDVSPKIPRRKSSRRKANRKKKARGRK